MSTDPESASLHRARDAAHTGDALALAREIVREKTAVTWWELVLARALIHAHGERTDAPHVPPADAHASVAAQRALFIDAMRAADLAIEERSEGGSWVAAPSIR